MKILHVFDHTLPLHSGYTFRSAAILRNQRKMGWETFHLSGPKQLDCTVMEEEADGLHFYRIPTTPRRVRRGSRRCRPSASAASWAFPWSMRSAPSGKMPRSTTAARRKAV